MHPEKSVAALLPLALMLGVTNSASAGQLSLSSAGSIDISGLNIATVGDLALVDQRIWVSDGTNGVILLETVPIPGLTARIADIAFDSDSGGLYALCEDDQLRRIDITSGAILAT